MRPRVGSWWGARLGGDTARYALLDDPATVKDGDDPDRGADASVGARAASTPAPSGAQRGVATGVVVLVVGIVLLLMGETTTPWSYASIAAAVFFWAGTAYVTEMVRLILVGRD